MPISRRRLLEGGGAAVVGGLLAGGASIGPAHAQARGGKSTSKTRDSVFRRRGTGPLYWTIYGWSFPVKKPIPEQEWRRNIDWLAGDLAAHGYDLACTDGWIEGSTKTTRNGYIRSYNDSWEHDWAYWGKYLADRKMRLGVYYNPLWVCKADAHDPSKRVAGRPDIPLSAIVNEGDFFAGGQGQKALYWVDVTKEGAKEYVQGYVHHFRKAGAAFLRVDFLCWYETGWGPFNANVGLPHGRENYETALSWMDAACGDDIELSLVMPSLFEHGRNELRHGDLVRIDEDSGAGGWSWLSATKRQTHQEYWSQWHNPFLGFTGFSDISGRGGLILDGDFVELHKLAGDDERRTLISLFTMAGSPIAVADRYDSIGAYADFYKNPELLELNRRGFVGKPYYTNGNAFSEDTGSRDPERWLGQLPDGSWVVALFNRTDAAATRSIDFATDLGITGGGAARDLWAHQDLGHRTAHTVELAPHACSMIKITGPAKRYGAEVAAWAGGAKFSRNFPGYTGTGYVNGLGTPGAEVVFAVEAQDGPQQLTIRYASGRVPVTLTLFTGTPDDGFAETGTRITFPPTGAFTAWGTTTVDVRLRAGVNLLRLRRTDQDGGAAHLDWIAL